MDCVQVQWMLSAFLDNRVIEPERRALIQHMEKCAPCSARHRELVAIQRTLAAAPLRAVDRRLALNLRVMASREAARRRRQVDFQTRVRDLFERAIFSINTLMKPLALPAAGGVATAVLLFLAVMTNFQGLYSVPQPNDLPTALATEAWPMKQTALLSRVPDEITVEVLVDGQGRIIDYTVPAGASGVTREQLRRAIGNSLPFIQFHPATSFGQPTSGWVSVTLRRTQLDVEG